MVELAMRSEVGLIEMDMCAFGMTSKDEQGEGLVKKSTRILSSSEEVLRGLDRKCRNKDAAKEDQHRHVHLIQGRAKGAQVYPRPFAEEVCKGIAAQKRSDSLGMKARP